MKGTGGTPGGAGYKPGGCMTKQTGGISGTTTKGDSGRVMNVICIAALVISITARFSSKA